MEIPLTEEWLKELYAVLINIYKNTDDPIRTGFPIVTDFNEPMLNVCINRPYTKIYGKIIYPHILHRATVNIHSIINFHPFVDGNKRVALLSTYYYLIWNGYSFVIPNDADEFTIKIAKERLELNEILCWLKKNVRRTPSNVIRRLECQLLSKDGAVSTSKVFLNETLLSVYLPRDGLKFFVYKIIDAQQRKRLAN
jgi:death on curing protein